MLNEFRETAITWDKANRKIYESLRASAGDNKGRKLSVQLVNDGVIEDLSGASLSLFWETRDKTNKGLDAFTAVDATKGEFEIYYTTGMLSNEGTLNANLVLVDTSGRVVSEPFTITVFKGIDDDAIQSSDSFTALAEALITVNQYNSRITNVENTKVDKSTFEQNNVSINQQLQQTSNRTEQYQGDLVELLQKNSTLKDKIAVRYVSPNTLEVAVFYKEKEATIYTFKPDNNGWYRLFEAVTRQMSVFPQKETKNRDSITGTWSQNNPNHYATSVGSTFTADFFGTGCYLQTYANDQGGIWEIVVDGVYSKTISTWSATAQNPKVHHLFENLPEGNHTMVGTFKGDDPDHVPSGGAGTSRGWLRYGTLVTDKGVGIYFTKIAEGAGLVTAFEGASRKEFAFLCAPTEISALRVWVPEHDGSSVLRNISTKIFFGEREVTLSSESPFYQIYDSVKIQSEFKAYNPNDDALPMFEGRIEQKIDKNGVHVTGHFDFMRDTFISSGYTAMMAIARGSTRNNAVVDSFGKRHLIDYYNTEEIDTYIDDKPFSIMHFVNPDTLPPDILTNLTNDARDTVQAMRLNNYMTTMRFGKKNVGGVFVRSRADGNRKTYYQSFENHTAVAGESLDFSVTYFVGKIVDASKILPSS